MQSQKTYLRLHILHFQSPSSSPKDHGIYCTDIYLVTRYMNYVQTLSLNASYWDHERHLDLLLNELGQVPQRCRAFLCAGP